MHYMDKKCILNSLKLGITNKEMYW